MGKKSVVFVAELSYMEKLEVALKSLCAHKGQWKIYVLNENLPTEWFTLMNRRLEAIDSEILNCRVSAESFKQFSLPSNLYDNHLQHNHFHLGYPQHRDHFQR